PDHDPTVLNSQIRKLLNYFEKRAYVGYTATPFANIFIHEKAATEEEGDDLFPRNFIVNMPAPSDYYGPEELFKMDGSPETDAPPKLVRYISDHAATLGIREKNGWVPPVHKSSHLPRIDGRDELPGSLRKAILSFVLATCARRARGEMRVPNTMLIHVTKFTNVQREVGKQVQDFVDVLERAVCYGGETEADGWCSELRQLWQSDFESTSSEVGTSPSPWEDIEQHLETVVKAIKVKLINGSAGDVLEYEKDNAPTLIAIGGDKLSRGLTLEGLTVSYFLRATTMYDTLMQMGRWFGYKPGYSDLCRIFMTRELERWYGHIAKANEELRQDFDHMVAVGGTPRDFGHKVRSHPTLLVTSRVKMRHSKEVEIEFSGNYKTILLKKYFKILSKKEDIISASCKRCVAEWLARRLDRRA
ncbi:MAG: hypothetical protein EOP84_28880, partial [Verrucomicrobiaceae bacterium]